MIRCLWTGPFEKRACPLNERACPSLFLSLFVLVPLCSAPFLLWLQRCVMLEGLWCGCDFGATLFGFVFVGFYAGHFGSDESQDFKFPSAGFRGGFKHGRC